MILTGIVRAITDETRTIITIKIKTHAFAVLVRIGIALRACPIELHASTVGVESLRL